MADINEENIRRMENLKENLEGHLKSNSSPPVGGGEFPEMRNAFARNAVGQAMRLLDRNNAVYESDTPYASIGQVISRLDECIKSRKAPDSRDLPPDWRSEFEPNSDFKMIHPDVKQGSPKQVHQRNIEAWSREENASPHLPPEKRNQIEIAKKYSTSRIQTYSGSRESDTGIAGQAVGRVGALGASRRAQERPERAKAAKSIMDRLREIDRKYFGISKSQNATKSARPKDREMVNPAQGEKIRHR